uniref:Retrovirus-related Pol polyprotein from transposon TNT 1-94 n=1 Tax=Tanacetum cinerariifolium TaxID=118510 RepID=A0A6L2NPI7_TANCI|nr:retrovirus-related Pol polyprotein from transposon TNT 1-94 [Tanacetum cinerariifolium]
MKVEESLNVTFDESHHPTKLSPLVDDDVGEEEAIENNTKVRDNNNIEDESIEVDEVVNNEESKSYPLKQVIGTKWVYRNKLDENGMVSRNKARLVSQGYNHQKGELYTFIRKHGRMILESIENGLLVWPTVEENGVTRTKKYVELSAVEKIQVDYDMKATNIILQSLPADIYSLVNHHRVAKDL